MRQLFTLNLSLFQIVCNPHGSQQAPCLWTGGFVLFVFLFFLTHLLPPSLSISPVSIIMATGVSLFPASLLLSHLSFVCLGPLPCLPPVLTCSGVNQTAVLLPGGMCVDKTGALPSIGPGPHWVQVGWSEESTPPGSGKRHKHTHTRMHAIHTSDHFR